MTQETTYESLRADKCFQVEIHERLLEVCQQKGIPPARLRRLIELDRDTVLDKMADLLVIELGLVATVTYQQPSFGVLKHRFPGGVHAALRQHPFTAIKACEDISLETRELSFEYLRVVQDTETNGLMRAFRECGLRPAVYEELLSFCQQYPEEHLRYPIVALGSTVEVKGVPHAACVWGGKEKGRDLRLLSLKGVIWTGLSHGLLGVKKKG